MKPFRFGVLARVAHSRDEWLGTARRAETLGCQIEDLSDEEFHAAHPAFEPDVRDVFDLERSVEARGAAGGTSRAAVSAQMELARRSLARS